MGLDIGTDSVGWAVTDKEYHVLKRNGKALWGVRLFEKANTAEERRVHRVARRRIERRRQRIQWLQGVFAQEIGQADPAFFQRLRESCFLEEDKRSQYPLGRYTLFADRDYCDRDYHREYPTIYHLRKALLENKKVPDIRLVYLAVHHIMKNRGHFLYGGLSAGDITLEAGLERLSEATEHELKPTEKLREILLSRELNKTEREKQLAEQFSVTKKDVSLYAAIKLLAGSSVSLDSLYGEGTADEELKKISLEEDFQAVEDKLSSLLGDRIELILAVREIYDWALLESIRDGEEYLSFAKVKVYEKHEEDLKKLKKAVKALNNPELYKEIFHRASEKVNNYPAYSGKDAANYRCTYDDFKKYLKNKLKAYKTDSAELEEIFAGLDDGTFLPKQTSKNNGIIPYQLHKKELEKILENAAEYYPFLLERDESGLSKKEQIEAMFSFRIPYYVGPLDSRSEHSWVERSMEKIYPWNFERVVNLEQCRENFITRMTAKCSYIGEDVLPRNSLLYTKFMVLNELNKLKVNGRAVTVETKQQIYNELFLTGRKVTQSRLRTFLNLEKEDELSGIDKEVKAALAPWKHYEQILKKPGGFDMAEDIILHISLFGDDKKLLRDWLEKSYGKLLTAEEQKQALAFKCSGWGRLSRCFLTELYHVEDSGEVKSIMDKLWETNDNLMELLSGRYGFAKAVEEYRRRKFDNTGLSLKEYLDESYASPSVKRAIYQVAAITAELEKILKAPPERIFVEMAREDGEKGKRSVSRKAVLTELYKKCGEESTELFEKLQEETDATLRRDKLYLYYTQLGRCMYSEERIDLNRLDIDYDIDHIYPQSKTKDDSLDNRVLVKKQLNAKKGDIYPIKAEIRAERHKFWAMLKEEGLVSKEKYQRLTRTTEFEPEELAGFINRQLVETRQSCKIVAELLQQRYGEKTEIVYVKAGNVSSFRQDQRLTESGEQRQAGQCRNIKTVQDPLFVKCREINAFHHAKDAYLNIVVGNVYHVKFTRNPACFLKTENGRYSLNRMFDFDVCRNGDCAWKAGDKGSIAVVRQTMRKNNILFTRRTAEVKGGFFYQLIVQKGKGQAPIKGSDPRMSIEKYGGYNKLSGAFFALVEHTVKKKRLRSLETVFLMNRDMYEREPERYCREVLGLAEPKILISRIKFGSLVSFDGFRMHLSGRTGDRIIYKNANNLLIDPVWHAYVKNISKYLERCKNARQELPISGFDGLTGQKNKELYRLLSEKLQTLPYSMKLNTAAKTLREQEEKFSSLCVPEQCRVLKEILNIFQNSAASADLKLLNGKAGIGILLLSKNFDNYKGHELKLIHQSVTGFYEREIDLMAEDFK